jgi:hypothetical protein
MIATRRRPRRPTPTAPKPPARARGSRPGQQQHMRARTGWTGPAHPPTPPTPKGESPPARKGAEGEKRHREKGRLSEPVARRPGPVAGYVRYDPIRRAGSDWDVSAGGLGARKGARERDKTRRRPWTWRFPAGWQDLRLRCAMAECSADRRHMPPAARPCDPALRRAALPSPASGCRLVACRLPLLVPSPTPDQTCEPAMRRGHDCRGFVVRLLLRYIYTT